MATTPVLPEPEFIKLPLGTNMNHVLDVNVFQDSRFSTPEDVSGETAVLWIAVTGGTWVQYPVTFSSPTTGVGTVTITGSQHTVAGQFEGQLHHEGILKRRYTFEFVAEAS